MNKYNFMGYIDRDSIIHKLTGKTKLILLLIFSIIGGISFDTRVLLLFATLSIILFLFSKIKFKEIKIMLIFFITFMFLNIFLTYIIMPTQGCIIYQSTTILFSFSERYVVTAEHLFYILNVLLKYIITFPIALLFILTTNPSEFASSLNTIKISYKICYSVSLALRYIPDILKEYNEISMSQQAKGVQLGKNVKLSQRVKNSCSILFPIVLSSINRIETVTNAMELRGFGKYSKRTWYIKRDLSKFDILLLSIIVILFILGLIITFYDGNRFFNPFI